MWHFFRIRFRSNSSTNVGRCSFEVNGSCLNLGSQKKTEQPKTNDPTDILTKKAKAPELRKNFIRCQFFFNNRAGEAPLSQPNARKETRRKDTMAPSGVKAMTNLARHHQNQNHQNELRSERPRSSNAHCPTNAAAGATAGAEDFGVCFMIPRFSWSFAGVKT